MCILIHAALRVTLRGHSAREEFAKNTPNRALKPTGITNRFLRVKNVFKSDLRVRNAFSPKENVLVIFKGLVVLRKGCF